MNKPTLSALNSILFLSLISAGISGCANIKPPPNAIYGPPPPPDPAVVQATYQIGPGDIVQVDVFRVPDLSTKGRVGDSGTLVIPLVGPVRIAGQTPEQASRTIAEALAKNYLNNPQVSVQVLESANMKITISGAVKKPGVFPLRGNTTLVQALALAEGPNEMAKPDQVLLFRQPPGQTQPRVYVVDVNRIQSGELPDPILAVNDTVVVPESGIQRFNRSVFGTMRGFISFGTVSF